MPGWGTGVRSWVKRSWSPLNEPMVSGPGTIIGPYRKTSSYPDGRFHDPFSENRLKHVEGPHLSDGPTTLSFLFVPHFPHFSGIKWVYPYRFAILTTWNQSPCWWSKGNRWSFSAPFRKGGRGDLRRGG